jgi:CheY-like chemotaxis protein
MSVNEQPSILTVCVPGIGPECTPDEIEEILAARDRALSGVRSGLISADRGLSSAKGNACDDSACGIDALLVGSSAPVSRLSEVGSARLQQAEAGSGVGTASGCTPSFFHADSGKKALELLRMLRFDLLVTGDRLPDMPVGQLIRRVRVAWPWQKWAMVGSVLTAQDEIAARSLGAMAVFDAPPDWDAIGSLASAAAGKAAEIGSSIHQAAEPPQARFAGAMQLAGDDDRSRVAVRENENSGRPRRKAVAPQSVRRKVSDRSVG